MRISDWSSDVCSSDLKAARAPAEGFRHAVGDRKGQRAGMAGGQGDEGDRPARVAADGAHHHRKTGVVEAEGGGDTDQAPQGIELPQRLHKPHQADAETASERPAGQHLGRSEEHTSELQSLMRISYAVFCLKKKKN